MGVRIKGTYVYDVCGKEEVQEVSLLTINTEMPKLSKMDIPVGWLINSHGALICDNFNNHIEKE